jgi:hypothetical protein
MNRRRELVKSEPASLRDYLYVAAYVRAPGGVNPVRDAVREAVERVESLPDYGRLGVALRHDVLAPRLARGDYLLGEQPSEVARRAEAEELVFEVRREERKALRAAEARAYLSEFQLDDAEQAREDFVNL